MKQSRYRRFIKNGKGQLSSGELLMAYFAFFIVFMLSVALWTRTVTDINAGERLIDFEDAAADVGDKLVKTQGLPSNWTNETVTALGLADEPRMLNREKVLDFLYLMNDSDTEICGAPVSNYECNKHLLGLGRYHFYLNITDINDSTMSLDGVPLLGGRAPVDVSEENVITITRSAILDKQIAKVRITFWYNLTVVNYES